MKKCNLYTARPGERLPYNAFITPNAKAVQELADSLLYSMSSVYDMQDIVETAFNWVAINIRYITDKKRYGCVEYWAYPEEVLNSVLTNNSHSMMVGDCEDSSFLLCSLLLAMGIPEDRVRVTISDVHAWTEVKFNDWYALETTSDEPLTEWTKAKDVYNTVYRPSVFIYYNGCDYK